MAEAASSFSFDHREPIMSGTSQFDLSTDAPPENYPAPLKALWWLKKGDLRLGPEWDRAHMICQSAEGETGHDWVHGLCHLIEEDPGNAAYWFRRAGKTPSSDEADKVWQEIAAALS